MRTSSRRIRWRSEASSAPGSARERLGAAARGRWREELAPAWASLLVAEAVGAEQHLRRRLVARRRASAEAVACEHWDLDHRVAGVVAGAHQLEVEEVAVAADVQQVLERAREQLGRAVDVPGREVEQTATLEVVDDRPELAQHAAAHPPRRLQHR